MHYLATTRVDPAAVRGVAVYSQAADMHHMLQQQQLLTAYMTAIIGFIQQHLIRLHSTKRMLYLAAADGLSWQQLKL